MVHSKTELQRRPVRADSQKDLHKQLIHTLPRALYLESLQKIEESVYESGCRDEVPSSGVLKSISWRERMKERKHNNEIMSLWKIVEENTEEQDEVLQKVLLLPKGVMLWSQSSIAIFHVRSKEDIVYLDAAGSNVNTSQKSEGPFYVYEGLVRHPRKG